MDYACLATATDDIALTRSIERVVEKSGLALKYMRNEDGSTLYLHPETRQTVRTARVFIAALAPKSWQATSVIYGIGIAQYGQVPIVIVSDDVAPSSLEGQIFGAIPKQNVFLRTSSDFSNDLAVRLRQLASIGPVGGEDPDKDGWNVFVSYAGEDKKYADELSSFLRFHNITFWDYDRSRRRYDDDFEDEIEKAISGSATYVGILTPKWRSSQWVRDEFKYARRIAKSRLVLEFEKTDPILSLTSLTLIDCKNDRMQGFHELLTRLDQVLEKGRKRAAR
jgi:TIR domain